MIEIKRILHPTDFSVFAQRALRIAFEIADRTGAELHVAHVVYGGPDYRGESASMEPEELDLRRRMRYLVASQRAGHSADRAATSRYELISASTPAAGILRYAGDFDIDLIVMGTHGRHGVRRLVMGSGAARVIRAAHCDVVTVPKRVTAPHGRILVPVDLLERSQELVEGAGRIAALLHAGVDLMHVLEIPGAFDRLHEDVSTAAPPLRQVAANRLRELASHLAPSADVSVYVERGDAAAEILKFIRDHGIRLVVMASSGMTPDERMRRDPKREVWGEELKWSLGGITTGVVMASPAPVYLLKRFADTAGYAAFARKQAPAGLPELKPQ